MHSSFCEFSSGEYMTDQGLEGMATVPNCLRKNTEYLEESPISHCLPRIPRSIFQSHIETQNFKIGELNANYLHGLINLNFLQFLIC